MSYPDYPNNRLIVNGTDLSETFGLILLDGYQLSPPEPKTYTVDIPGGNGVIDLTESLLGDVPYNNRTQTFNFLVMEADDFERTKTQVSRFLHGKSYDYTMTMDPGYTYHGRFTISSYSHSMYGTGKIGTISISISANPYKIAKNVVARVPAVGGKMVYFDSGRMRVIPKIETNSALRVIKDDTITDLPAGTWTVNDLYFHDGSNELYFNSYQIRNLLCSDLYPASVTNYYNSSSTYAVGDKCKYSNSYYKCNTAGTTGTWDRSKWDNIGIRFSDFKKKRLFQWYKSNGDGTYVYDTWDKELSKTWSDMAQSTWGGLMYLSEVTKDINDIYVEYEVGEL